MRATFLAIWASLGVPFSGHAAELTVWVTNVQSDAGQIICSLYSDASNFLDTPAPGLKQSATAQTNTSRCYYPDLPDGTYAAVVMHDENSDGELESNLIGYPLESWGMSNDPLALFGPPTFEEAAFTLEDSTEITVKLSD
tara:strand:+ start:541 stop:960 length:420 start_codon:yes stop_codon:yes gene_type:complete